MFILELLIFQFFFLDYWTITTTYLIKIIIIIGIIIGIIVIIRTAGYYWISFTVI